MVKPTDITHDSDRNKLGVTGRSGAAGRGGRTKNKNIIHNNILTTITLFYNIYDIIYVNNYGYDTLPYCLGWGVVSVKSSVASSSKTRDARRRTLYTRR